ncbi:hypothetical protein JVT61DRAFT_11551 [Boletus reticuloceps]|uniref:Uncharacterized protein n=1 Tax=Boletus reticuloceps TaxID=495285 RepID=A0A8I2YTU7_9AGAM|nr:hypothetical protein JVT61DRAFT_11551 [Boletus reticuloceps]
MDEWSAYSSTTELLHHGLSLLPAISFVVETASLLGMTMTLSLSLDLISILTAHLHACHFISSTIYRHVLLLIGSLWNLFRGATMSRTWFNILLNVGLKLIGKRYNILRNRTDPWDYDVDQLLLGTILFTLAAHLFPTILVYYTLFALVRSFSCHVTILSVLDQVRLGIIVLYASCETLLAFMNHFPLFALMLRSKDPQRLPGR